MLLRFRNHTNKRYGSIAEQLQFCVLSLSNINIFEPALLCFIQEAYMRYILSLNVLFCSKNINNICRWICKAKIGLAFLLDFK